VYCLPFGTFHHDNIKEYEYTISEHHRLIKKAYKNGKRFITALSPNQAVI